MVCSTARRRRRYDAPMLTVNKLIAQGHGLAPALVKRAPTVVLDWDKRCKSRFDAVDSQGRHLGVFLPRGSVVRGGDLLVTDDGSLVKVIASPQPVMVVRTEPGHGTPFDLLRAAYHLGNRHVPVELTPDALQFEPDPVLADMLRRMHLVVTEVSAPFDPEGGAYVAGSHGHDHATHDHGQHHADPGHDHGHGPADHDHDAHKSHGHVHGPGCGHDH
jgi:urease accessory protein